MSSLPKISENAAVDLESILLILESTQDKKAANEFFDAFLKHRPLVGLNPKSRPKKIINGITYYRFLYPTWNYILYYEIVDGITVIDHIVRR